jgi:hypothetical protein
MGCQFLFWLGTFALRQGIGLGCLDASFRWPIEAGRVAGFLRALRPAQLVKITQNLAVDIGTVAPLRVPVKPKKAKPAITPAFPQGVN